MLFAKLILVMLGSLLMVVVSRLDFNIEFVVKIVIGGLMELEQIEVKQVIAVLKLIFNLYTSN